MRRSLNKETGLFLPTEETREGEKPSKENKRRKELEKCKKAIIDVRVTTKKKLLGFDFNLAYFFRSYKTRVYKYTDIKLII